MRLSRLFSQTFREKPAEAEVVSHQLLLRAGYIRQSGAGFFTYLPLGLRVLRNVESIMREEMSAISGQELLMPVVQPAEVWKETRRNPQLGSEMSGFRNHTNHEMALAMTHAEVVADLTRALIHSYRQLPAIVFHIQTKWRDDPHPRAGLIRLREFSMLDSYSLDGDWQALDASYQAHHEAFYRIFARCGLPAMSARSDSGSLGGNDAQEFMYLTPIGEDSLMICEACGYSANRQVATVRKPEPEQAEMLPLTKIATPGAASIEELAAFLGIASAQTAKVVFFMALLPDSEKGQCEKLLFAVVRGDMEVNETKLANLVKTSELRPATDEEILASGAVPGYASPCSLRGITVVTDELVVRSANLVTGANEEGFHLLNANYGRDYQAAYIGDITAARAGDLCPECGEPLRLAHGVQIGKINKIGTRYTDAHGGTFVDEKGETRPVIMGSYGIELGRLIACAAEEHHDEHGLIWPVALAPYPVHIVSLKGKELDTDVILKRVEDALTAAGLESLVDDREESAGVKFNDADLIGLPIRLTVSERAFKAGGVEIKIRRNGVVRAVAPEKVVEEVLACLENIN